MDEEMSAMLASSTAIARLAVPRSCCARILVFAAMIVVTPQTVRMAIAGEVEPTATMDAAAANAGSTTVPADALDDRQDIPDAIYDAINAKIARQTTFLQIHGKKFIRWAPRAIDIVEFYKVPSPTFRNCALYAMTYRVAVASEVSSLDVHGTICVVTVVVRDAEWTPPTVVCEPVDFSRVETPS